MVIDLLPQLSAEKTKLLQKKKFLEFSSVACLAGAIVFVLAVFGYLAILGNEAEVVNKKIAEAEVKVNRLADRESLLRGFKLKIEFLTKVLEKRPEFHLVLVDLYESLPAGVSFSEISLAEKEIIVSGVALSSFELGDFIGRFKDVRVVAEKEVEKVTLTSAIKDKTGFYRFSVKIIFKS